LIAQLVCLLLLVTFYLLQMSVFSQMPLISGTADLILLFFAAWTLQERVKYRWIWVVIGGLAISLLSAMPFFAPLVGYVGVYVIARILQRKVWQAPMLAMLIVTLLGTLSQHIVYIVALQVSGAPISWGESLDRVILPSVLLNLLFALPMYAIVNDVVGRLFPLEVEP
jgi:rod shape-determining protein MreD